MDLTVETALRKMYGLAWEAALRNSSGSVGIRVDLAVVAASKNSGGSGSGSSLEE